MKDFFKRIIIVGIILLLVAFVFKAVYYISSSDEEKIEDNITESQMQVETQEEISDTDEIESYENVKARCTTNLNFRSEPNAESEIIATIPSNTVIEVLALLRNGWYKVSYIDNIGYVSGDYITFLSETEMQEITVAQEYENTFACVNTTTNLNIRESANSSSTSLTSVKPGSVLKVISCMENGWYYVEGNAIYGYVSNEYISILTSEEYTSNYSSTTNNLLDSNNNIIATYTTTSSYGENSRYNMQLAATYMNGVVVAPGETYSHLSVVHPEGVENIYVSSYVFTGNGEVGMASGGGICQTSSTIYAAIVSATENGIITGLNVTAQAPHSGSVTYVPRKYEATVNTGTQDFCFRNCNEYSIKVVTSYNYNTLTVTLYKI